MKEVIDHLREHQQQLDADGIMVGVSRQALEEVLDCIDALTAAARNVTNSREPVHRGYFIVDAEYLIQLVELLGQMNGFVQTPTRDACNPSD